MFVDVNNDGVADYDVEAADLGALTTGVFNGIDVVAVFGLEPGGGGTLDFLTDAPTDSSTMVLPVDWSLLCDPGAPCLGDSPHFTYWVNALSVTDGTLDKSDGKATFNFTSPAVNNGMFDIVPANGSVTETLTVNPAEQAITPALGWMVVSHSLTVPDMFYGNSSRDQAQLIPLHLSSHH